MNKPSMISNRKLARLAYLAVLSMTAIAAHAQNSVQPAVVVSQLAGSWQIALVGNTGCGFTSMLVNVTLNSVGTGTATNSGNSAGCAPSISSDEPFAINSLNPNGSGTANLSCGPDCGWEFNIQVAPNRQIFNLVDVINGGNYLTGTAVRQ